MADFSEKQIQDVWNKGQVETNFDPEKYRKDPAGAWIVRDKYGMEDQYGWTIDHVYPESKGGKSDLINLRPMHWENNLSKSDDYPEYKTVKVAVDNKNVDKENNYTVKEDLQGKLKDLYNL